MADGGWIKLYRSVRANWIWDNGNERYAKWWMDILMMVNHEARKVPVNGKLVVIGPGERLTSIRKLALQWEVNRKTVDEFLNALEADKMISVQRSREKGTRLKVLNYGVYQGNLAIEGPPSVPASIPGTIPDSMPDTTNKQELQEPKNDKKYLSSSVARKDVLDFWQKNGFGILASKTVTDLDYWVKDFQEIGSSEEQANGLLVKAMSLAVDQGPNAMNYRYVNGILTNWEKLQLKSPEEVDAHEQSRNAGRDSKNSSQTGRRSGRGTSQGKSYGGIEF